MSKNNEFLKKNLLSKSTLFEIILIAVIISLGTNVVVNAVFNFKILTSFSLFLVGLGIIFLSSFILFYKNFKSFNQKMIIEGLVIYDKRNNSLVSIDNYDLSFQIASDLKSAFVEDKSLEVIWKKNPLSSVFSFKHKNDFNKRNSKTSAREIIEELFEYIYLDNLSVTLTDFFNNDLEFKKANLVSYERKDIPDILLKNRFLNLFSKPLEEREAFIDDHLRETDAVLGEKIVMSFAKNGAWFNHFDLVLPKNTKIKRSDSNKIFLENNKFKLDFSIDFDGISTNLPIDFEKYYLGLNFKDYSNYNIYRINLNIKIKFKLMSLFSSRNWKYYYWIDKYLDNLNKSISFKYFLNSINWNQIRTMMYVLEKKKEQSILRNK